MTAKIKYTSKPVKAKVIEDFFPPPDQLLFRDERVQLTPALRKKSVKPERKRAAG